MLVVLVTLLKSPVAMVTIVSRAKNLEKKHIYKKEFVVFEIKGCAPLVRKRSFHYLIDSLHGNIISRN